jgi:Family of unknown function (DUF6328)
MALSGNVKTALDETRTLILGGQILLGFQFHSVFQERFDSLSSGAQMANGIALVVMVVSIGLLIAPSAYHRLVEKGEDTGRMQRLTGKCVATALLPFAVALGLDLTITLGLAFHNRTAGSLAGAGFAVLAGAAWYGVGELMKRTRGQEERQKADLKSGQREKPPLHARIEQMLTEGRVILPGAQALLGFQLVIVLTTTFERLPESSRILHGLALLAVTISVTLLMTPAALHRIVWAGEDTEAVLRIGGPITVVALFPLALGMSADAYVVFARIAASPALGGIVGGAVLGCLLGLWFIWPFTQRSERRSTAVAASTRMR